MKTTRHRRLALLAGLLLALIVFATGIAAAQAKTDETVAGSGTASFTTPTQPQGSTAVPRGATGGRTVPDVPATVSGSSAASAGNAGTRCRLDRGRAHRHRRMGRGAPPAAARGTPVGSLLRAAPRRPALHDGLNKNR